MAKAALKLNNVSFSIHEGFWMKSKNIVHDMNIEVPQGTVLGLVGPNGAGKTTTIKLMAGLLAPQKGEAYIFDFPALNTKARKRIGLLTENQYIYPHLRLGEWLYMLAGFSGLQGNKAKQGIKKAIELVDLTGREKQLLRTFSKGQLQRAGIAQALVHDPDILLLDEPMSGLDPFWRYRIQKILGEFKATGKTILFSSHILSDVERLCDKVVLIESGTIRWKGSLDELPRNIRGYEAICHIRDMEQIKKYGLHENIMPLPGNKWRITIPLDNKKNIFKLASDGAIELESFLPIQEELEKLLFGFQNKSQENR